MSHVGLRLHHFSIAAPESTLEQLVAFYGRILDLEPGYRPDFGIPGYWLYAGDEPIIHLIEDNGRQAAGRGYFDHVALRCTDLDATVSRLVEHGIDFRRVEIKAMDQVQLFLTDPAGTSVELNFLAR